MARRYYKAVLFAPDGDWVTDFRGSDTIEGVQEDLSDMGSRWYFYPYHAVIVDHGSVTTDSQHIVDAAEPFEDMSGLAIKTMARFLRSLSREAHEVILS